MPLRFTSCMSPTKEGRGSDRRCDKDEIIKTLHFDSETGMPQYDPVARRVYLNLQEINFCRDRSATDEVVGRYASDDAKETTE